MIIRGATLKKLRLQAGLTQHKLAEHVGISQAHIAKIEREKVDPRLSTVNRILQVLTEGRGRRCRDVMTRRLFTVKPDDNILKVSRLMMKHCISQLPVVKNGRVLGTVTEESIVRNLSSTLAEEKVEEIMEPPLPIVPENTSVAITRTLLEDHTGVLVAGKGEITGIITRSDLLKTISKTL